MKSDELFEHKGYSIEKLNTAIQNQREKKEKLTIEYQNKIFKIDNTISDYLTHMKVSENSKIINIIWDKYNIYSNEGSDSSFCLYSIFNIYPSLNNIIKKEIMYIGKAYQGKV